MTIFDNKYKYIVGLLKIIETNQLTDSKIIHSSTSLLKQNI